MFCAGINAREKPSRAASASHCSHSGTARISPRDYPGATYSVFGSLRFADGSVPGGTVQITAP